MKDLLDDDLNEEKSSKVIKGVEVDHSYKKIQNE